MAVAKTVQNRIKSSQLHKILEEIVLNGKVAPEKLDEVLNNISNSQPALVINAENKQLYDELEAAEVDLAKAAVQSEADEVAVLQYAHE